MSGRLGTVVIVGVGLIGGSLGMALRASGACSQVIGADQAPLDEAIAKGAIDRALPLSDAAAAADILVLATPVRRMATVVRDSLLHLKKDAIVTDTGSVKTHLVAELTPLLGDRYVPAHPIAGGEKSGVAAARADLFQNATCILSPLPENAIGAVRAVSDMWEAAGARLEIMTPEQHDEVFAWVSHLPHLVAFGLMEAVGDAATDDCDPAEYSAGGLRDFTRVGGSNPEMWRDIFLTNRDAILKVSAAYRDQLERFETAIKNGDGDALLAAFARSRITR